MKVSHHSKNGTIIAEDTETAFPNADKNNKTIKINHKNVENQINHFISTRKKMKIYPTKTFIVIIIQENHFQITQITLDNNHLIFPIIDADNQTKENHEISHKTDIRDQTVGTISVEITIQDQIQTDLNFRLIPVRIQILEIEIIQMIDLETLHIIEIENIPTIGIETIQMIEIIYIKILDHEIILTKDQTTKDQIIITMKINHATIHRTEFQVITTDKETTLNHDIGITNVIKFQKKIIEVVQLNFKSK